MKIHVFFLTLIPELLRETERYEVKEPFCRTIDFDDVEVEAKMSISE